MTLRLRWRADAPLARIRWTGPLDPVAEACSLCGLPFGEDDLPFRLMGETRFAAFCDPCFELCIVIETETGQC